jgi:hypothetical protein
MQISTSSFLISGSEVEDQLVDRQEVPIYLQYTSYAEVRLRMLINDDTTFVPFRCKIVYEIEEPNQSTRALNCGIERIVFRAAEYLYFHAILSNYEKWNRK